jgi:hypothetical protein
LLPGSFAHHEDFEGQDDGDVDGGEDEHGEDPAFALQNAAEDEDDVVAGVVRQDRHRVVDAVRLATKHTHLKQ